MSTIKSDAQWMQLALQYAAQAAAQGEVPVGAIVVRNNELIGHGFNQCVGHHDPSAHAEIRALRMAAKQLQNYRLPGCQRYVTLEPCVMCVVALFQARIARLVYAASDPKTGAVDSVVALTENTMLNHHLQTEGGICAQDSAALLRQFFQARR